MRVREPLQQYCVIKKKKLGLFISQKKFGRLDVEMWIFVLSLQPSLALTK
jgi:hypothetical protein